MRTKGSRKTFCCQIFYRNYETQNAVVNSNMYGPHRRIEMLPIEMFCSSYANNNVMSKQLISAV